MGKPNWKGYYRYRNVIGESEANKLFLKNKKVEGGESLPINNQPDLFADESLSNSIDALYSEQVQKSLPKRQGQVYEAVKVLGVANYNMIVEATGLPINVVIPRVKELTDKGLLKKFEQELKGKYGFKVLHFTINNNNN